MEQTGMQTEQNNIEAMRKNMAPLDLDDGLQMDAPLVQEEDLPDDIVKIRDAVTDKTIVSVTEAKQVRDAANQMDVEDVPDDIVKIRDAITDKTIVSVTEAKSVRDAANRLEMDDLPDDVVKIRDAMTDQTIVSVTEAKSVRDAANRLEMDDLPDDYLKIRDAMTDETIVSVEKARSVHDAVRTYDLFEEEEEEEDLEEARREQAARARENARVREAERREANRRRERARREMQRRREEEAAYRERARQRERQMRRDAYAEDFDDYEEGYYDYDARDRHRGYRNTKSPLRFIPLVLVIALCVLAFITARAISFDNPVNPSDYTKISYTVTADTTTDTLAQDLLNLGLIDNPLVFRLRSFFYSAKYKEGEYELSPSYSTEKIINILSGYDYNAVP